MAYHRDTDGYPFTWEPVALSAGLFAAVTLLAVHLGRAIANATVGAGWAWPPTQQLVVSVPRVLAGDGSAGLEGLQHAAPPWQVWMWVGLAVAVGWAVTSAVLAGANRRWGSGAVRGTACASEAQDALGVRRLYRQRRIIRPDLYDRPGARRP